MTAEGPLTVSILLRAVDGRGHHHLGQVRRDQRRTAALLGFPSDASHIYVKTRGHRQSFLPSHYWGKPVEVRPPTRPTASFIRDVLNNGRFSLPPVSKNTLSNRDNHSPSAAESDQRASDGHTKKRQPARPAGDSVFPNTTQSLPSLPAVRHGKGVQGVDKVAERRLSDINERHGSGQLPKLPRQQRLVGEDPPLYGWPSGEDGLTEEVNDYARDMVRSRRDRKAKIQEKLTVHVPGLDGSRGRAILQKLSSGDVQPPLVSINSSASTGYPTAADSSHFLYHHKGPAERANLPSSDYTVPTIEQKSRSPFHIRSVLGESRHAGLLSPVGPHNSLASTYINSKSSLRSQPRKSRKHARNSNVPAEPGDTMSDSVGLSEDVDGEEALTPVYSDYGSSIELTPDEEDRESLAPLDESENEVDTMIQKSEETILPVLPSKPRGLDEGIPRSTVTVQKKPVKARGEDYLGNVHRRAYLAALSVARSLQLTRSPSQVGRRLSRPFRFSYFQHIPHQRPCRCAECRERRIGKVLVPRKNKAKKLSPIKSIFGPVKVEDYYPRRIVPIVE